MQGASAKPPIGVIYDSDFGGGVDTVLGMAALYGLASKGEARVVSLSTSRSNLTSAAACEVMARFYSGGFLRLLPVGMSDDGKLSGAAPVAEALASKHEHSIHKLTDTAEVGALIRNAHTGQHDGNTAVVLCGRASNLAATLSVKGAAAIIASKCKVLVVAVGAFPGAVADPRAAQDVAALRTVTAEWPSPIVFVGASPPLAGQKILEALAWGEKHPVRDGILAGGGFDGELPGRDVLAVMAAANLERPGFKTTAPGTVRVLDDGRTEFAETPGGRHRLLSVDPAGRDALIALMVELIGTKPAPPRRRPGS